MSLFEELKRRNVFRVGIAYLLASWLILQIIDFMLELTDAPTWVLQVFFIAALVGAPIALILSWVYELTPDGIKRESDIDHDKSILPDTGRKLDRTIIVFLGVAIALLLADRFIWSGLEGRSPATEVAAEAPVAEVVEAADKLPSLAVLPFQDLSPEGDQAYFSDGIAEEILNVLVKTDRMKVAGRTSSFQFEDSNLSLREIAEQLGVQHILEGSVRKAGNRVRITAQLLKADDGFHLWSETYDRELTDIFAVQDEIARSIADALAVQLDLEGSQLVTASTGNMLAYEKYLAARSLISARFDFARASSLATEATELDPDFAPAWAARAQILALLPYYELVDRDKVLAEAEVMAKRAIALDPGLSTAHSVLGDVYRDRSEFEPALASYTRAVQLNPSDVEAHQQLAQFWLRLGFFEQSLHHAGISQELDPLSWVNLTVQASAQYLSGDREGAWASEARSRRITGVLRDYQALNSMYMALSEGNQALAREVTEAFVKARSMTRTESPRLTYIQDLQSKLDDPEAYLASVRNHYTESDGQSVRTGWEMELLWATQFGDLQLARDILVVNPSGNGGSGWMFMPVMDVIKARYPEQWKAEFIEDGALEFWQSYGFPDFCTPLGDDDFECEDL